VVKEGIAQIGNQALTDGSAEVTLPQAKHGINHGNTDHPQGQPIQPGNIAVGNRVINQVAVEQRRNQVKPVIAKIVTSKPAILRR
jgi:hypothetical protein